VTGVQTCALPIYDYLAKGLAARDACAGNPLIEMCLAPHAPYTVSDRSFERISLLAADLNCPIHVHLHETRQEIEESEHQHGCRPIARFDRLGLMSSRLIAVHAVHLLPAEIELLAHTGVHVAHCPTSNLKLAAGIAPMTEIDALGINFGLGTDGAASNNRLDIFHEMRHAALLAKGASGDATALTAHRTLAAATIGGARALGMGERIGSLKTGKAADMISVRLDHWELQPCFDPASHIVYAAGREHVSNVWVAGEAVLQNGEFSRLNPAALSETAQLWHNRVVS
jgi:5-methylthioadenosine/S-adenosylhomocysteine deaminase